MVTHTAYAPPGENMSAPSAFFLRLDALGQIGQVQPALLGLVKRQPGRLALLRQLGQLHKVAGVSLDLAIQRLQFALI